MNTHKGEKIKMALRIKTVSDILGMKVFTDSGDFFGEIEEANLLENKVDGWRIKIARESSMASYLGGARGLIVPHQFVKAVGDIIIVNKSAVPSREEEAEETAEVEETA